MIPAEVFIQLQESIVNYFKMLARSGVKRPSRGLLIGAEAPAGSRAVNIRSITIILLLVSCCGCATHADRLRAARQSFYSGNILTARERIDEELKKGRRKELDVLKLDQAVIDLFSGDTKKAKTSLREVRSSFDHLEQKSATEGVLAMLTDDNAVSYAGEDYEKVMLRVLLTLADLVDEGNDAAAYSLQINAKQDEIIRNGIGNIKNPEKPNEPINPKWAYKYLAIGPYLRGLIREETLTNYDDAFRAYQQVVQFEPNFRQGRFDLDRVAQGRHSAQGNGVVYVFTFTGRGPYKEKETADATQLGLLIADQIFSATNKYSVPPTVAPVPIPKVVAPYNRIQTVGVSIDGQPMGNVETITDVSRLALEQYEANRDMIIARAVMRRIVKKGTVYAAKEVADVNPWISLAMDLGGIAWEATEAADTRCWGLLPEKIQVLRLELPEGEHEIALTPKEETGRPIGEKRTQSIRVHRGRNTYVLANFVEERLVGKVVVSSQ